MPTISAERVENRANVENGVRLISAPLLAICIIAPFLASCSAPRVPLDEVTIWRGHPSIVLCHDRETMLTHCPGFVPFGDGGSITVHGRWEPNDDCIYLLAHGDTLTGPEALYLAHELQHVADERHRGNLGGVLADESGTLAGDVNFDTHGWATDKARECKP